MTLQTDNGGEFGKEFQVELPDNVQFVQVKSPPWISSLEVTIHESPEEREARLEKQLVNFLS